MIDYSTHKTKQRPCKIKTVNVRGKLYQVQSAPIDGKDYNACIVGPSFNWTKEKKTFSKYQDNGFVTNTESDFVGRMGEIGFSILTGLPIDWTYKQGGDKGIDFLFNNYKIDVKTQQQMLDPFWVPTDEKLMSDYYVFCFIEHNKVARSATANFVGYMSVEDVLSCATRKSPKFNHHNYLVFYDKLKSMDCFLEELLGEK